MSGWGVALEAIGGGMQGAGRGLMFNQEQALDRQRLEQQGEIQRLQQEIKVFLEQLKEGGRNERWSTPSGNTQATQEGQNFRFGQADATRRRGQDLSFDLGMARDATTQRGQTLRDATTRRGQDLTRQTAIDQNTTANRRIDVTSELGMERNAIAADRNAILREAEAGRISRAEAVRALREQEIKSRERIEEMRRRRNARGQGFRGEEDDLLSDFAPEGSVLTPGAQGDIDLPDEGTGRPTATPIELEPEAQGPPMPTSPEATADQVTRLETQARQKLAEFQRTADPAKKKALGQDLLRLRDEIAKARGGR